MDSFIPVNEPLLRGNELKYLEKCIKTGWISSEGSFVKEFEEKFAQSVSRKYGIAASSGSGALDIAVAALGLKKGDEVIMPDFTIISCAASLVRQGIKPVLVDSDSETWNMDANKIKEKITPKTKAIMIVHIYGLSPNVDKIIAIAKKYNLLIIEDAAEAHGQFFGNKPCGSFGDISIFSFYPNKNITSGEGGMVVTDNEEYAEKCQSFRNLCFKKEKRFVHDELGWNYRMTNLQAAVGLAQLEQLKDNMKIKQRIGKIYQNAFQNLPVTIAPPNIENTKNTYWVFGLLVNKEIRHNAEYFMKKLGEKGIGTRPFFVGMHQQPVFIKMGLFKNEEYPISKILSEKGFYIPSGLGLTPEKQEIVIEKVIEVFNEL